MQLCLEPGFLAEALRREDINDLPSAVELLLSEIMLLGGLALAHYKQQAQRSSENHLERLFISILLRRLTSSTRSKPPYRPRPAPELLYTSCLEV